MVCKFLVGHELSKFQNQLSQKELGQSVPLFGWNVKDRQKKIKGDLKTFSWVGSKMLLANQIAEFLNELYFK